MRIIGHRLNGQLKRKERERVAAHVGSKVNSPRHLNRVVKGGGVLVGHKPHIEWSPKL